MKQIKRNPTRGWNAEQIEFLTLNYGRKTAATMARELDRSLTSVDSQLYKMRKQGLITPIVQQQKCQPVTTNQKAVNRDAVQSETLFLIGYGDYPMFYKKRVRDGLEKAMKDKNLNWFWDRRDWTLSRWLEFFSAA